MQVGVAYILTGGDHPGHCAVVFRGDLVDTADPAYQEWGDRTYGSLEDTVRAVAVHHKPALDIDVASRLCWSAMQALLILHPSMEEIAAKRGENSSRSWSRPPPSARSCSPGCSDPDHRRPPGHVWVHGVRWTMTTSPPQPVSARRFDPGTADAGGSASFGAGHPVPVTARRGASGR